MDHSCIRDMQDNAEKKSIEMVNSYLNKHECTFMRYSLLWTAFRSIMDSHFEIGSRRKYPVLMLGSKNAGGDYYLSWGVHSSILTDLFYEKGIRCMNIRLTSGRIGLRRDNTLYIPLHRSAKAIYSGCSGIEHNFRTLIDNISLDEKYLRNIFNRIFCNNKPRFIMVNEDRTKFVRLLIEEAKNHNITVFVIQHGMTPATPHNHIPFANESFTPLNADYICAWGQQSRDYLIKSGVSKEQVEITGTGAIDVKGTVVRSNRVTVIDQQFIGQKNEMEYTYTTLVNALNRARIDFRIYLRGTYNAQYLKKLAPNKLRQWEHGAIWDIMGKSRAVIGFYSTAIIEAALQNTHVLSYDALHRGDIMNFGTAGIEVYDSTDYIIKAINDGKSLHYELGEILYSHGKSADANIFKTIMEKI